MQVATSCRTPGLWYIWEYQFGLNPFLRGSWILKSMPSTTTRDLCWESLIKLLESLIWVQYETVNSNINNNSGNNNRNEIGRCHWQWQDQYSQNLSSNDLSHGDPSISTFARSFRHSCSLVPSLSAVRMFLKTSMTTKGELVSWNPSVSIVNSST
jgi:hypothetical protein